MATTLRQKINAIIFSMIMGLFMVGLGATGIYLNSENRKSYGPEFKTEAFNAIAEIPQDVDTKSILHDDSDTIVMSHGN